MKRRNFLGGAVGAAATGPKLVQESVTKASFNQPVPPIGGGIPIGGTIASSSDEERRFKRVCSLVAKARGQLSEQDKFEREIYGRRLREQTFLADIDALHSVSLQRKHRMAASLAERLEQERASKSAIHELLYGHKIPRALWKDYV